MNQTLTLAQALSQAYEYALDNMKENVPTQTSQWDDFSLAILKHFMLQYVNEQSFPIDIPEIDNYIKENIFQA